MATVASFTATPTTVPSGSVTRLAVTFNTAPAVPGTPDKTLSGQVKDPAGTSVANVSVTFQGTPGTPAEPVPSVALGNTPGQWCVVVDSGTLVGGPSANTFDWRP